MVAGRAAWEHEGRCISAQQPQQVVTEQPSPLHTAPVQPAADIHSHVVHRVRPRPGPAPGRSRRSPQCPRAGAAPVHCVAGALGSTSGRCKPAQTQRSRSGPASPTLPPAPAAPQAGWTSTGVKQAELASNGGKKVGGCPPAAAAALEGAPARRPWRPLLSNASLHCLNATQPGMLPATAAPAACAASQLAVAVPQAPPRRRPLQRRSQCCRAVRKPPCRARCKCASPGCGDRRPAHPAG